MASLKNVQLLNFLSRYVWGFAEYFLSLHMNRCVTVDTIYPEYLLATYILKIVFLLSQCLVLL